MRDAKRVESTINCKAETASTGGSNRAVVVWRISVVGIIVTPKSACGSLRGVGSARSARSGVMRSPDSIRVGHLMRPYTEIIRLCSRQRQCSIRTQSVIISGTRGCRKNAVGLSLVDGEQTLTRAADGNTIIGRTTDRHLTRNCQIDR